MKKYYWWVRQILEIELNSKNEITAINALDVSVLVYSFKIFNWLGKDTQKIVQKTRNLLTIQGIRHPKTDVNRPHIKGQIGSRGLVNLEITNNTDILI